jgi:hypothetical protein
MYEVRHADSANQLHEAFNLLGNSRPVGAGILL